MLLVLFLVNRHFRGLTFAGDRLFIASTSDVSFFDLGEDGLPKLHGVLSRPDWLLFGNLYDVAVETATANILVACTGFDGIDVFGPDCAYHGRIKLWTRDPNLIDLSKKPRSEGGFAFLQRLAPGVDGSIWMALGNTKFGGALVDMTSGATLMQCSPSILGFAWHERYTMYHGVRSFASSQMRLGS